MFTKLLKHEWRATRGIIGLLCVIILISGLVIGGVMHYLMRVEQADTVIVMNETDEAAMSSFLPVVCVLLLMAGIIAVGVCCAGSVFFVIYRFYKSRFTDEGYLTFTLPVTSHQLLLSSITNSVIGVVVVLLAACAAIALAVVLFLLAFPENLIWADVSVSLEAALQQIWGSLLKNGRQFALAAFSGIASAFSELIVLMLAVTIGAMLARKHKILAAVGVYYGISMVQSFLFSLSAISAAAAEDADRLLATPGLMGLVIALGGYFLLHYLTSKKLNLV